MPRLHLVLHHPLSPPSHPIYSIPFHPTFHFLPSSDVSDEPDMMVLMNDESTVLPSAAVWFGSGRYLVRRRIGVSGQLQALEEENSAGLLMTHSTHRQHHHHHHLLSCS